jgi:hypothetical protein
MNYKPQQTTTDYNKLVLLTISDKMNDNVHICSVGISSMNLSIAGIKIRDAALKIETEITSIDGTVLEKDDPLSDSAIIWLNKGTHQFNCDDGLLTVAALRQGLGINLSRRPSRCLISRDIKMYNLASGMTETNKNVLIFARDSPPELYLDGSFVGFTAVHHFQNCIPIPLLYTT